MTILYLVRHAIAEDAAPGTKDVDRALTDKGRRKFRKAARGLIHAVGKKGLVRILTSPLLRARQTAEILAAALLKRGGEADLAITPALGDRPDLEALLKAVRLVQNVAGREPGVAAVGHDPTLSEWIGELCFQKHGNVQMEKGGVAAIRLHESAAKGELLWLLPPQLLREV